MARSRFFGYTTCGYPFQRWSLSELPIGTTSVFNATTSASVAATNNFPITGTVINQTGANLQNNSVWIPGGFYRISWGVTVTPDSAGQVVVNLLGKSGTISSTNQTVASGDVITIGRETYITVGPNGTTLSLQNAGSIAVTMSGDLQISITKLL